MVTFTADYCFCSLVNKMPNPIELNSPITFHINNSLSVRLYPDNRPCNLEISALQKGLVLLKNGLELIEEGAGFGVPVIKYSDHCFFSGSAQTYVHEMDDNKAVFTKLFDLNTISRKQIYGAFIQEDLYSIFQKSFERAYHGRKNLRAIFDWLIWLRKSLGVETQFVNVESRGKVAVTYSCSCNQVSIHIDLSALNCFDCKEILILNEQGANFFRKYSDSSGKTLLNDKIEAWEKVSAEYASMSDLSGQLSFSLKNVGGSLFRGREFVPQRFCWSGLAFALNPEIRYFEYNIVLE